MKEIKTEHGETAIHIDLGFWTDNIAELGENIPLSSFLLKD